jgi:hypothetical protein
MRPYSRIIQIVQFTKEYKGGETEQVLACLCEDGSVWLLDPRDGSFQMVTEMDGTKYVSP